MKPLLEWDAPEHHYTEKNNDWYWQSVLLRLPAPLWPLFLAMLSLEFSLLWEFLLVVHASKKPEIVHIEINDRGIVAAMSSTLLSPSSHFGLMPIKSFRGFF